MVRSSLRAHTPPRTQSVCTSHIEPSRAADQGPRKSSTLQPCPTASQPVDDWTRFETTCFHVLKIARSSGCAKRVASAATKANLMCSGICARVSVARCVSAVWSQEPVDERHARAAPVRDIGDLTAQVSCGVPAHLKEFLRPSDVRLPCDTPNPLVCGGKHHSTRVRGAPAPRTSDRRSHSALSRAPPSTSSCVLDEQQTTPPLSALSYLR